MSKQFGDAKFHKEGMVKDNAVEDYYIYSNIN